MDLKDINLYAHLVAKEEMRVVNVVNVWSNGNKIRKFSGKNSTQSIRHSPSEGYRKMVAILVEVSEDE